MKQNKLMFSAALLLMVITMLGSCSQEDNPVTMVEAVDLGLPSGLKWANMNVGASKPEDFGTYFAWGETTQQSNNTYNWSSYKWCNKDKDALTKYCSNPSHGYKGFTDFKEILDKEDDAARANWGRGWRMPTNVEIDELLDNTTSEWTTLNGVSGRKFTSKTNGKSIFLPAGGQYRTGPDGTSGSVGYYWASVVYKDDNAYGMGFTSNSFGGGSYFRSNGLSVRPVR